MSHPPVKLTHVAPAKPSPGSLHAAVSSLAPPTQHNGSISPQPAAVSLHDRAGLGPKERALVHIALKRKNKSKSQKPKTTAGERRGGQGRAGEGRSADWDVSSSGLSACT